MILKSVILVIGVAAGLLTTAEALSCYSCSGEECLNGATFGTTVDCNGVDDSCYTTFSGFNPVGRGCRSTLGADDQAKCDNAEDVSCDLCKTDVCNLRSREDHQCQYCSSVVDATCVTGTQTVVQCPAPTTEISNDAQCYTRTIGSVTERGCLSSAADAVECKSSVNCLMCAITGGIACNNAVYPSNRRKCTVGTTADQYCPNPTDNCVQIFQSNAYTKKCQSSMSAAEVSFCKASSNKCDFCATDNCNAQNKVFNYLECLTCLSSTDAHCTTNPTAITTISNCQTCATLLSGTSVVKRGCLASLTAAEQAQCTSGTTCQTCSTNKCNTRIYPADRLACYTCLGGSCFSHDSITLEYCPNYQTGDSCVVQTDATGQLVRMGCKSSLSTAEAATCNANAQLCRICTTSKCNEPSRYMGAGSCVQCTSANDHNCIGKASTMDAEPCNDPENMQCFSRLVSTSATERGCVSDLDATSKTRCAQGTDCSVCSTTKAKCNSREYPMGQIKCHQCDSKVDATCKNAQSSAVADYCKTYNTANKCYVIVQKNGDTVRKCSTQLREVECAGSDRCEVCYFGGCNHRVSTAVMSTAIAPTPNIASPKPNAANRLMTANLVTVALMVLIAFAVRHPTAVV